ncbi:MAG: serine--tRNA ligase [Acidimicrobiia bacterium]|nr:serine--tRNA ligase [Acidimicrobiia bacterium]
MLDVNLLRKEPERIAATLAHRGISGVDLQALAALDEQRRAARSEAEALRAEQKELGGQVARLEGDDKQAAIARGAEISVAYKAKLAEADDLDDRFDKVWIPLPNLVHDSVPKGETEDDNEEIKRWGEIPEFGFTPKDHLELAAPTGIIDMERAAKISGSRFGLLTGKAVLLEFALVRWVMDRLGDEGFTPVVPPVLVREEALFGTGFFPDDDEQVYAIPADDLYLVGTSEVALASMHADEIFPIAELPRRYVGFSTCFRRESGAAGRDTRGIFRLHQFDKLEMFSFCHPDESWAEHDFLFAREEALVQELGIPYRVVNVCSGDLGASAAKKYDIEAWFPGQERYREITSCSNTTDYQSRRLKIRVKDEHGNRLLHTLNGTAVAIQRTLVAIMENFQQADGTVRVPEALVPYTGFESF